MSTTNRPAAVVIGASGMGYVTADLLLREGWTVVANVAGIYPPSTLELAPHGIRVNAITPGWVDTPGNAATGRMAAAAAAIPLGRVAQPVEIARWVLLLAGQAAGFMTGETVVLPGDDVIR
jgi:3-oxoacyl-[acyl-carrier protein] reductase